MKTFYEMLELMEADVDSAEAQPASSGEGLGDQQGQQPEPSEQQDQEEKIKHYMFFSNLKMIKEKAEAILAMDAYKVDQMLSDGHDWASDHISTSRDDIEEVYNWLAGEVAEGGAPMAGQDAAM